MAEVPSVDPRLAGLKRLARARRIMQDLIDAFEGLAMARPDVYRDDREAPRGLASDLSVAGSKTPSEIVLPDTRKTRTLA